MDRSMAAVWAREARKNKVPNRIIKRKLAAMKEFY
jgi:hypothetical protein